MRIVLFYFLLTNLTWAAPIKIKSTSNLVFGIAPQGDLAKTIAAGTSDNAENASFTVTGDANRAFSIVLPASPITMTTSGGGIRTISVSNFTSYPTPIMGGVLNGSGSALVLIGATRAALNAAQKVGSYSGNFSVTVVY